MNPEVTYTQDLIFDSNTISISEAVSRSLDERLLDLKKRIVDQKQKKLGENIVIVDAVMAKIRELVTIRRHPVYKKALDLAVNALCYITAYPDDIKEVWPEGTPINLTLKAEAGSSKEQQRAKSKLAGLGYSPVHLCGQRIVLHSNTNLNEGHHLKTHWRRGHWRNQAYGQGRELRKLIWIMPSLIGTKQDTTPIEGHIYLVS